MLTALGKPGLAGLRGVVNRFPIICLKVRLVQFRAKLVQTVSTQPTSLGSNTVDELELTPTNMFHTRGSKPDQACIQFRVLYKQSTAFHSENNSHILD